MTRMGSALAHETWLERSTRPRPFEVLSSHLSIQADKLSMRPKAPPPAPPSLPRGRFFARLHDSVLLKLGLSLGFLALLSFVSILISTVIADSSSGKASAINISGSLRMMSFRLLSEIQQPEQHAQIPATLAQFEYRLKTLEKLLAQPTDPEIIKRLPFIHDQWFEHIRPLVNQAIQHPLDSPSAISPLSQEIPEFVAHIDEVVLLIERDLEQRIHFLRVTQIVMLALALLITLTTVWMLRRQLIRPLAELLKAARTVASGSFTTRVSHTSPDELGQLGQAFNTMMEEIGRIYAHQEELVLEKTRELVRSHESLELLYQTTQRLAVGELNLDTIKAVLHEAEAKLELGHSMICISEHHQMPAQRMSVNLTPAELSRLCENQSCERCFAQAGQAADAPPLALADDMRVKLIKLRSNGDEETLLPVVVPEGGISREKLKIMETVGRHIINALDNMRRTEEKHRLAALEERSVIARELHDSIAQSLSYLNIQVMRLEKQLAGETAAQGKTEPALEAQVIAAELKHGLKTAYRELRELITTFRLRVDERGFNAALQQAQEEFSLRCGFAITANNGLAGILLSGNEEMHLIRIIREALANIEKHAQASEAHIHVEMDEGDKLCVSITDNGRGFDPLAPAPNHFGLIIMRDRANILGGEITIHSAPTKGTRVYLTFHPQQFSRPDSNPLSEKTEHHEHSSSL